MIHRFGGRFYFAGSILFFFVSAALSAYFYLFVKDNLFDDVFIYANIAQNAVEHGTWRYFPFVPRDALLASSPLKVTLLTASYALIALFHSARSVFTVNLTIFISGLLSILLFLPAWRKNLTMFLFLGGVFFISSLVYIASLDFEGGLLFLWLSTLLHLMQNPKRGGGFLLSLYILIGIFIRPDCALIVYACLFVYVISSKRYDIFLNVRFVCSGVAIALAWLALAYSMGVYPLPVTYWGKASLPRLVENTAMIQHFIPRLGEKLLPRLDNAAVTTTFSLAIVCLICGLSASRSRYAQFLLFPAVILTALLLIKLPSSFHWYYENFIFLGLAILFSNFAVARMPSDIVTKYSSALIAFTMVVPALMLTGVSSQRSPWSFKSETRSQSYLYIARHATGHGTYNLPGLGEVLIKNPEIGITSYFSGKGGWIWDSASLAQPLDAPEVQQSKLQYLYPLALRQTALADAKWIAQKAGKPLPAYEVWAMDNRDFEDARKKCAYVNEEGALCANPSGIVDPL